MCFFDHYQTSLESYIDDYVTLAIVEVALNTAATDVLVVGEESSFRVQIRNEGPLGMADVIVHIRGSNGTRVKNNSPVSRWQDAFTTELGQFPLVTAHNDHNPTASGGRPFGFLAPSTPQPRRTLVDVIIVDWLPDLDHLHETHSHGSTHITGSHQDAVRASGS